MEDFEHKLRTRQMYYQSGNTQIFIKDLEAREYVAFRGHSDKFDKMFFPWISDTGFYDERTRAVKRCKIPKGYPLLEICTILDRGYVEIQSLEA